jgi:shikimate dehydrogenase
MRLIDTKTELYGLVGSGISYTLSPAIHNFIFEKAEHNAIYYPFDVPEEKFDQIIRALLELCKGLNVTIPYKERVVGHLNSLDATAEKTGAVNTIFRWRRYNTDYIALRKLISKFKNLVSGSTCYIFGAGGVVRAVAVALGELGCEAIVIINRTLERALKVVHLLKARGFNAYVGNSICNARELIVANATPNPDFIPDNCVENAKLVIELVYRPVETSLVKRAAAKRVNVINGLEILVAQAVESQRIWLGIDFPEEEVVRYLYARQLVW